MGTVAFDTLRFVRTLETSGLDARQAEGIATAFREASADQNLVTKDDLKAGLNEVKTELRAEIAAVKTELKTEIAELRVDISTMKVDLVKWIVGLALALFAAIISLSFRIH